MNNQRGPMKHVNQRNMYKRHNSITYEFELNKRNTIVCHKILIPALKRNTLKKAY